MQFDGKVLLGRLYERTSQRGNKYFSGRLGTARIMLFHDDKADVDNCWQMFVQDGDDKAPQTAQEGQGQEKTAPTAQKRTKATSGPENAPDLPFHDDGLENLLQ